MSTSTRVIKQRNVGPAAILQNDHCYVLVTAAYNEESYIEQTIRSVVGQTLLPGLWVIVSDGSTDATDDIVGEYARKHTFMRLLRRERDQNRHFASKVFALNAGLRSFSFREFPFIGHLDADVVLDPSYFSELLHRFHLDCQLGLGGGWYCEKAGTELRPCWGSAQRSIPGGIQMFRRECYAQIGGLLPIEFGGEDWYAEIMARKCGWRVQSFPELRVHHLRAMGTRASRLRYCYREGIADFAIGSHPLFELAKICKRVSCPPYFLGAVARLLGFAIAHVCVKRLVPLDVTQFLRSEELSRLWPIRSSLRRKRAIHQGTLS